MAGILGLSPSKGAGGSILSGGSILGGGAKSPAGKKPVTKEDLQTKKKNALQRLAGIPGGIKDEAISGGKSTLVHVLDLLGRPGQASLSAIKGAGPGGPVLNPTGFLKGGIKGLTGKDHTTFQEAVKSSTGVSLPTKGALGVGVGLVGSVATDPTTYLTLGTTSVARAGLKGVGETLGEGVAKSIAKKGVKAALVEHNISKDTLRGALESAAKSKVSSPELVVRAGKVADKQLRALEKGAKGGIKVAGRTLVPGAALGPAGRAITEARPGEAVIGAISRGPIGKTARVLHSGFAYKGDIMQGAGKAAGEAVGSAERLAEAQAAHATEDTVVRLHALGKKLDSGSKVAVVDALHDPQLVSSLTPKQRAYFDVASQERAKLLHEQLRTGVLPEGIRTPNTYFPRVATPEFHKLLESVPGKGLAARLFGAPDVEAFGIDLKQGFRKSRRFMPEANVRDVNTALEKAYTDAGFKVKPGTKFFHEDPTAALGLRAAAANRAVSRADFISKLEHVPSNKGVPLVARVPHLSPADESEIRAELKHAKDSLNKSIVRAAKASGAAGEAKSAANFARSRIRAVGQRGEDVVGAATVDAQAARKAAQAAEAEASSARTVLDNALLRKAKAQGALRENQALGGDVIRRLGIANKAVADVPGAEAATSTAKALKKEAAQADKALAAARTAFAKSDARLSEIRKTSARALEREKATAAKVISPEELKAQKTYIKDLEEAVRRPTNEEILSRIPEAVRHEYVPVTFNGEPIAVHHSLKKSLESMDELVSSDDAVRSLGKVLHQTSQLWKGMATVLPVSGGFFSRNAATNVVAAWLHGLKDPRRYFQAERIMKAALAGRRAGEIGGNLAGKDRELWELARKYNVIGGGFNAAEIGNTAVEKGLGTAKGALARAKSLAPIRAGRNLNSAIENNARLALFIDQMAKHGDPELAAKTVNEALFDYGAKTPLEGKISDVVAFYTFMRKNIALQAKQLAKQPGKATAIEHFRQALIASAPPPPPGTETPQYLRDEGGFLLPKGAAKVLAPGSKGPTYLEPDIGFTAAGRQIDPFIKAAQALIPGGEHVDTAKLGRDLLNVPSGLVPAALQALNERATGKSSFTGAPSTKPLGALLPAALVPGIGKTRHAVRDIKSHNLADLLAGVKATEVTDQKQKSELYRQLEQIQARMAELKRQGTTVPTLPKHKRTKKSSGILGR